MDSVMKEIEKCAEFLLVNGWERVDEYEETRSYCKYGFIGVDLTADGYMVFIGDSGDFLHLPICKYTLIGVLLEHRQIPINYKSPRT